MRALYEGPAEDVPWFVKVDGVEVRAITRHPANNRVNGVARERYAGIVAKQGLLAEMRVPPPAASRMRLEASCVGASAAPAPRPREAHGGSGGARSSAA